MSRYKDADAMIQDLKRQYMFLFGTDEIPNGIGMFIENFPAADVAEIVHGEWIKEEEESKEHVESIYICSACHNFEAWGETEKYNYCPNCGAKMDGGRK